MEPPFVSSISYFSNCDYIIFMKGHVGYLLKPIQSHQRWYFSNNQFIDLDKLASFYDGNIGL